MNFFKNHWGIIVGALALALVVESPLIAFKFLNADKYQGINIAHFGTDEHLYLTRGNDALAGHYLGNPILREGKDEKTDYYFTISEYILVWPVRALGLEDKIDIVSLYNIYNFVGIFILILLVYFSLLEMINDKWFSGAAALFVIGGYSIIYYKGLFYSDFNIYGRAIYPYVSSIFFFGFLLLLLKALKSDQVPLTLLTGAAFGVLFYIYFYAWTFVLAFNVVFLILLFLWRDAEKSKRIFYILFTGLAIGSYNIWRVYNFILSPAGRQFSYFSWSVVNHKFVFMNLGAIAVILFFIFFYKKRNDENAPFILALILSGWVAINQQVVTGRMIQYNHYYWFFIQPLIIIVAFYMAWKIVENKNAKIFISLSAIFIVFINTAGGQIKSYSTTLSTKLYEQIYAPTIYALNQNRNSSVILAANDASAFLFSIYTKHDLFWHSFAALNDNPIQRFQDAIFVYFYLNKNTRSNFSLAVNNLTKEGEKESMYLNTYEDLEGYLTGFDFYDYHRRLLTNDALLQEKRKTILASLDAEYSLLNKNPQKILNILNHYGVAYIVWDKNKYPEWDLSFIPNLKEIAQKNGIFLYKI